MKTTSSSTRNPDRPRKQDQRRSEDTPSVHPRKTETRSCRGRFDWQAALDEAAD